MEIPTSSGSAVPRSMGRGAASPAVPAQLRAARSGAEGSPTIRRSDSLTRVHLRLQLLLRPGLVFHPISPQKRLERPFQGYTTCGVICKCKRWVLMTCRIWYLGGNGAWRSFFASFFLENRLSTDVALSVFIKINRKGLCPQRPSRSFSQT